MTPAWRGTLDSLPGSTEVILVKQEKALSKPISSKNLTVQPKEPASVASPSASIENSAPQALKTSEIKLNQPKEELIRTP